MTKKEYRQLLAELYQILSSMDAPVRILDQVWAASQKEKLPHKTLLPFVKKDK